MSFIDFVRSKYFWINLLIAVVVLLVVIQSTMFYLKAYTNHGETVTVPDLRGMTLEEANILLQTNKLSYFVMDSSYVVGKPASSVLDQDPPPDSKVKENRKIYVTINSVLPPKVKMPDLVDKHLRVVSPILESQGLRLGELTYRAALGLNVVLEQQYRGNNIKAGALVPKGSKINLVLGNGLGETSVEVPNLIGLTLSEAKWALMSKNLNLGYVEWDETVRDSTTAVIFKQLPDYDYSQPEMLNYGEAVDVYLTKTLPEFLKRYAADTTAN